tara:strand:- start:85 stop:276 length:192 start_codon:yes stop_codon:yes gene_type:complete
MLTNIEIKLLDRHLCIYAQTFDKHTFYKAIADTFPSWRGEELFENDAYEEYLETLTNEVEHSY